MMIMMKLNIMDLICNAKLQNIFVLYENETLMVTFLLNRYSRCGSGLTCCYITCPILLRWSVGGLQIQVSMN